MNKQNDTNVVITKMVVVLYITAIVFSMVFVLLVPSTITIPGGHTIYGVTEQNIMPGIFGAVANSKKSGVKANTPK
jgi:hypothetical protein